MYAIIKTGGKQYRVSPGDVIDVELLDAEHGSEVKFEEVLFFNDGQSSQIGGPFLTSINVTGTLLAEAKGPKVVSIKYKKRQNQRRKFGHRQRYSRVKIGQFGQTEQKAQNQ